MPDITIVCRECGREHKVSEYAKVESLKCAGCKAPLQLPQKEAPPRGISVAQPKPKAPETMPDAPKAVQAVHKAQGDTVATSSVHDKEVELTKPPWWHAVVCFALVAGLGGYFLTHVNQYQNYLQYYVWARNILFLGTILLVLVIAYHDSMWFTAVSIVFPPYMLWYAWTRLESFALKGLFFGIIAVLVAEVYYLRDYAIATHVQQFLGEVVVTVDDLIERAAE
jgi:hypothetical protein